jgi:hypothetical protein
MITCTRVVVFSTWEFPRGLDRDFISRAQPHSGISLTSSHQPRDQSAMSRDDSPVVRDVSPDEGYTYMHRAFFQAFLTHSVMAAEEIKLVLAHVMTAHSTSTIYRLHYTST